jgi:hypothetical protein
MVRNEVEDEMDVTLCEGLTSGRKSLGSTEIFIDDVAAHAIRRADIVFCLKIRESPPEILKEAFVSHGDFNSDWAPFPHSHEPHGGKSTGSKGIPLLFWNGGEIHGPFIFLAQLTQPHPRVDLIDDGMLGPGLHLFFLPLFLSRRNAAFL